MNLYRAYASKSFAKELRKTYGPQTQKNMLEFIINNIDNTEDPRETGFSLGYQNKLYIYSVGDLRPRAYIKDQKVIFIVISAWVEYYDFFIKSIDYDDLLSIMDLCNELGFSYNELVQKN